MIKVTFKGQNPEEIRQQAMTVFGLIEPVAMHEADAATDVAQEPAAANPPRRGRKAAKAEPSAPITASVEAAPATDDMPERPAFLDAKPKTTADADPAKLLEQLRATAGKCTEAGVSMVDITKLIQTFKTADGAKAMKMSLIRAEDLPKAIAACEALLPAKAA